jgi:hypothetical protein
MTSHSSSMTRWVVDALDRSSWQSSLVNSCASPARRNLAPPLPLPISPSSTRTVSLVLAVCRPSSVESPACNLGGVRRPQQGGSGSSGQSGASCKARSAHALTCPTSPRPRPQPLPPPPPRLLTVPFIPHKPAGTRPVARLYSVASGWAAPPFHHEWEKPPFTEPAPSHAPTPHQTPFSLVPLPAAAPAWTNKGYYIDTRTRGHENWRNAPARTVQGAGRGWGWGRGWARSHHEPNVVVALAVPKVRTPEPCRAKGVVEEIPRVYQGSQCGRAL